MPIYPIPPGHVGLLSVLQRAYAVFGQDGASRLKSLLISGEIVVWRSDSRGDLNVLPRNYWRERLGDYVLQNDDFINPMRGNSVGRPVFLLEQVERAMPLPIKAAPHAPSSTPVTDYRSPQAAPLMKKSSRGAPQANAAERELNRIFPDGLPKPFDFAGVIAQLNAPPISVRISRSGLVRLVREMRAK